MANFPRLPRIQMSKKLKEVITEVNYCVGLLASSYTLSLEQCVKLLYAAGAVVTKLLPHQFYSLGSCSWQRRLENKISQVRRDLSRLVAGSYPPQRSGHLGHLLRHLHKFLHITSMSSFLTTLEVLKQKITSCASRLRIYKSRILCRKQNSMFRHNEKAFYSSLQQRISEGLPAPDLHQLQSFWQGLFEKDSSANLHASWLAGLSPNFTVAGRAAIGVSLIDVDCFHYCVMKLRHWAGPGPDGIQGFWVKQFSALHHSLLLTFNAMLNGDHCVPPWLPVGRTVLIPKNVNTSLAQNF